MYDISWHKSIRASNTFIKDFDIESVHGRKYL